MNFLKAYIETLANPFSLKFQRIIFSTEIGTPKISNFGVKNNQILEINPFNVFHRNKQKDRNNSAF